MKNKTYTHDLPTKFTVAKPEQTRILPPKEYFNLPTMETEMPTVCKRPQTLPNPNCIVEKSITIPSMPDGLNASLFVLFASAAALTLTKYVASEEAIMGVAFSANPLPLLIKASDDDTVGSFIDHIHTKMDELSGYKEVALKDIINGLDMEATESRAPLFDLIFEFSEQYQEYKADLILHVKQSDNNYSISIHYSDKLYYREIVSNMLEQYIEIIEVLLSNKPEMRLREAKKIPLRQKQQLLADFCAKKTAYNTGETIVESFKKSCAAYGDKGAVVFADNVLTYNQLDEISDRLAAHVSKVKIGTFIGILVERSQMMHITTLGVMKAGAAYMPLDPAHPNERIEFMLSDAAVQLVIADRKLQEKIKDYKGTVLYTDEIGQLPKVSLAEQKLPQISPSQPMIILYTSGTTGTPKGVVLTHGNVSNFCRAYINLCKLTQEDITAAYASFGFDASVMDMFPILMAGGQVHIISQDMRMDLMALNEYLNKNHITVLFLTTQLGRQLVEFIDNRSLRALFVGGETLVPIAPPLNYEVYNMYGPTECSVVSTVFKLDALYDRVPIGKPLDNYAAYVVDKNGDLAPVGVAGELLIAGLGVGQGYLNRPELTREKFIANPFTDDEVFQYMYRTGDVARYLPDGNIDFIGRRDTQVKIRGFRIELSEIEARIREYQNIEDATVMSMDDPNGGKQVIAYIVSKEAVTISELNRFISSKLPVYMVPAATMQIDKIPLNANGKVDKRALPKPTVTWEDDYVAPVTQLQKQLAGIAQEITGQAVGLTSSLLNLGLTSISSIKLAVLIQKATNKTIGISEIMGSKTIEKIAALLEAREAIELKEAYEKRDSYPLTQNQYGIYVECEKAPDSLVYNLPFAFSIPEDIDIKRLTAAIVQVIEAHNYVKVRLSLKNGDVVQISNEAEEVDIPVVVCEKDAYEQAKVDFIRPFALLEDRLFRIQILKAADKAVLLLDFHHIIFDGGSLDVFINQLSLAYEGKALKKEEFTALDLAIYETEEEYIAKSKVSKDFYSQLFADVERATCLQEDAPLNEERKGVVVYAEVAKPLVDGAANRAGVTCSSYFVSALAHVVSRYANSQKMAVATITNGREDIRLEDNFGMFVKTLPLIVDVPGDLEIGNYLFNTHNRFLETISHTSYPFSAISAEFDFKPQIMFAYQVGVINTYELDNQPLLPEKFANYSSEDELRFPIYVNVESLGNSYRINVQYDNAKFSKHSMRAFVDCIANALEVFALPQNQKAKLSEISICTSNQISEFDATAVAELQSDIQTLHGLFERWVQETPNAPALYAEDKECSYEELNRFANKIANGLIAKGVKKEDRIAFMLERDSRLISVMIGILKAGGVFLPIGYDYPQERIEYMLKDSNARFLITDCKRNTGVECLIVDELLQREDASEPKVAVNVDDLAYVIYTSGTTGNPKGAMLTHKNAVNFMLPHKKNNYVNLIVENQWTWLSVVSVTFDPFVSDVFAPLGNGLRLVLANDMEVKDPDLLAALYKKARYDAILLTPSRLLEYLEVDAFKAAVANVKLITVGGEKMLPEYYRRIRACTHAIIVNAYGPTETTIACNAKVMENEQVTIGQPLLGVTELVCDIYGNPLPQGAVGELWIGGLGVGRGYLNRPELTAEKFINIKGIPFYKSGDIARWSDNKEIVILGRNDGQVKLRGLRIELGEVENAVMACPGIKQAAILLKNINGADHLVAYYTAKRQISAEELKETLAKTLTSYMIPTAYLQLETMPLTANGKLDTRRLPEPAFVQRTIVPPISQAEKDFAGIFEKVLHIEQVGATDSFFELGGTSLSVTRVVVEAQNLGYNIRFADVFSYTSPRGLGAFVTASIDTTNMEADKYNYDVINKVLEQNTVKNFIAGEKREIGDVLLTGATGYLGIHVLVEFLQNYPGRVYCLLRGGRLTAKERLKSMLFYYFADNFEDDFDQRIFIVEGDITEGKSFGAFSQIPIDTVINCAANVKHFSTGNDIEAVNYHGVKNLLDFCKNAKCRFIQISTTSVSGNMETDNFEGTMLTEQSLYIGQIVKDNKYVHSKFMAERAVLEAILEGVDAKIMRVGNLMARSYDGEFQINFRTNSFVNSLKAYSVVGKIPFENLSAPAEFSPIDCTAQAILKLAQTPKQCVIFHPYNPNVVRVDNIIKILNAEGVAITACEYEEFNEAFKQASTDEETAKSLLALIAYLPSSSQRIFIATDNLFTQQILLRMGFSWPIIDNHYLECFIKVIAQMNFFDK